MGKVSWSAQAEADLQGIAPAVADQLRRHAEETLHYVRTSTAHEGVAEGIMWRRGISYEEEREIETGSLWGEDDDGAQPWDYFLFYRPVGSEQFQVLAVVSTHQIASLSVQMSREPADA
jgi:hypothetical protein